MGRDGPAEEVDPPKPKEEQERLAKLEEMKEHGWSFYENWGIHANVKYNPETKKHESTRISVKYPDGLYEWAKSIPNELMDFWNQSDEEYYTFRFDLNYMSIKYRGDDGVNYHRQIVPVYDEETGEVSKLEYHRDLFSLPKDIQGQGIGQEAELMQLRQMKDLANKTGLPVDIRLDANITIGAYAWAKAGYKFVSEAEAKYVHGRMVNRLMDFYEAGHIDTEETLHKIQNVINRVDDPDEEDGLLQLIYIEEEYPELADIRIPTEAFSPMPDEFRDSEYSIAKALLFGLSWRGSMTIEPDSAEVKKEWYADQARSGPKRGQMGYRNRETGEFSWDPPAEVKPVEEESDELLYSPDELEDKLDGWNIAHTEDNLRNWSLDKLGGVINDAKNPRAVINWLNAYSFNTRDTLNRLAGEHGEVLRDSTRFTIAATKLVVNGNVMVRNSEDGINSISYDRQIWFSRDEKGNLEEAVYYRSNFTISGMRGRGIGNHMELLQLNQCQDLANALGVPVRSQMLANIDIGGYAWAKAGYIPESGLVVGNDMLDAAKYLHSRGTLSDEQFEYLEPMIEKLRLGRTDEEKSLLPFIYLHEENELFKEPFDKADTHLHTRDEFQDKLTIGKLLLLDSHYRANMIFYPER